MIEDDGCPTRGQLEAMLADQLAPGFAEQVEAHIDTCAACQGVLDVLTSEPSAEARDEPEITHYLKRLTLRMPSSPHAQADRGMTTLPAGADANGGPPPEIPNYEILGVLGRGGMGVVYLAREARLKRVVALKMLPPSGPASPELVSRFQSEAEAIARLRHPNVVQIHAVGMHEGRPYIEMEYVPGGSLSARLDGAPRPPIEAARLVEALSRGVIEVHRLGLVHRDIKPGNVLLDLDETPKLGDFGLAKSTDGDPGLTRVGVIVGSPSYMAPEQAEGEGHAVGSAADVYALGAIYYELLTGRPPFRSASIAETLRQVRTTDPVPPSRLAAGVPRDADTICLKCLEKAPASRYASAEDLADDLRRFLDHRPIAARPISSAARAARWCRRNPWMAGLIAAVFLLLAAIAAVSLAAALKVAAAAEQERRTLYFARMNLVQQAWEAADIERMVALLEPYASGAGGRDLRGFEWYYWWRSAHPRAARLVGHRQRVVAVAVSRDGRIVASAEWGRLVLLWDRASGKIVEKIPLAGDPRVIAISPDGARIAVGGDDGIVRVYSRGEGHVPIELRGAAGRIGALLFRNDTTLLSGHEPGVCVTWDLISSAPITTARTTGAKEAKPGDVEYDYAQALTFSPRGDKFAAALPNGTVAVIGVDGANPTPSAVFDVGKRPVRSLAIAPDGRTLAMGYEDHEIVLRDAATGVALHEPMRGHSAPVWSLAFSPDGKTLAAGGFDNVITLWDVNAGRLNRSLKGHAGPINAIALSHDGRSLVSAGDDLVVRVWDVGSNELDPVLDGHNSGLNCVRFDSSGSTLATAGRDHRVVLWSVAKRQALGSLDHASAVIGLGFAHNKDTLVAAEQKGPCLVWDAKASALKETLPLGPEGKSEAVQSFAASSDGRTMAVGCRDGTIRLYRIGDGATKDRTITVSGGLGIVSLAFSPDGRELCSASRIGEIKRWGVADGVPRGTMHSPGSDFKSLRYSPDGRTLASGTADGTLILWDTRAWRKRSEQRAHSNHLMALAFTPDSRTLASGGRDNTIRLWDVTTGSLTSTLKGHTRNVLSLDFSRDGRTLASAGLDGVVRLWIADARD